MAGAGGYCDKATTRLGSDGAAESDEGCDSGRAAGSDWWRQWQGGETAMRASSRGGGGLRGEDGEDNSDKGREGGRGQQRVAAVVGDQSRRVWPVVGCGCEWTATTETEEQRVASLSVIAERRSRGCGWTDRWRLQGWRQAARAARSRGWVVSASRSCGCGRGGYGGRRQQ
ncbi:hypothetical protein BHE74_00031178 [Ensete ventricosum]|nr:hypothetical protein BHE74_00031178 [Ensete ventricosum]